MGHSREEVTRILIQSLNDLGYSSTANNLVHESGFELENDKVSHFRRAVLEGRWAEAEELLFIEGSLDKNSEHLNGADSSRNPESSSRGGTSRGLELVEGADRREMVFWMRQQKYLELLENRDLDTALAVLRHELTPYHQDTDRLHVLGG
jgi:WD repeat-containing protein 26